ncbi:hypothetical protein PM082_013601 [Marasmius tenuissimus]|nr:hypothetical protein PM082_013601 [Marasmius tenuissimus]
MTHRVASSFEPSPDVQSSDTSYQQMPETHGADGAKVHKTPVSFDKWRENMIILLEELGYDQKQHGNEGLSA